MKSIYPRLCLLTNALLVIVLVSLLAPSLANAQSDAFSVEVAVSERSDTEQQEAYAVGLRRVLLSNSGDKTILNRDAIRQALKQAENYVKSFSYRRPPPGTVLASDTPITRTVQQSGQATQLMLVSFDRDLVSQLISGSAPAASSAEAQAEAEEEELEPASAVDTNSALVWLLIRDQGRDIRISDPVASNVQKRAREIAGAAGISLLYPAGDEEDEQIMPTEDIAAQSFDPVSLEDISARYAQDTILIGYLTRNGVRGWIGQWTRINGEQQQQAEFETSSLDQALKEGLGVLNSVAEIDETYRYGGTASSDTEGLIWVGSVNSTQDYARTMRFLESIESVSTVYPKEVQTTSMVFSVVPRSALVDIQSVLIDVSWLRRAAPPLGDNDDSLVRSADLNLEYVR